ncbi:MAG: malectin domain-containing carbohydrate-binding protein [Acidobacteriota bacterium]
MNRSCAFCCALFFCAFLPLQAQEIVAIPDEGWHLRLDPDAAWKNDSLVLPSDVELRTLPVHPPTSGWASLDDAEAITVTLPSTVEQYDWGRFGLRPYHEEYAFEAEDTTVKNGNYLGVSWWWRDVAVPNSFRGRHAILSVRGARLRAEVFVNERLVGYHCVTETPFECDVTEAIHPGEVNRIAIRITNPGGRLDWVDTELLRWGDTTQAFHKSHGFGGLDRGLVLRAEDAVSLADAWVLNTPDMHTIEAHAITRNRSVHAQDVLLRFELYDAKGHSRRITQERRVRIPSGAVDTTIVRLEDPHARLWRLEEPALYRLRVTSEALSLKAHDRRDVTFGFRSFSAEGIGTQARLELNKKRIRLTSAISWGFWGLNGLWPTPELAEREVRAAKALGLNCLQFHRNIGKKEVLDAQDRLGLLRYMEPGGGQTAFGRKYSLYAPSPDTLVDNSGRGGEAETFAERYMEEKIIRMVRAHRSHPSLVMYAIQNEIHPDLHNPRVFRILRRIHEEDPSRIAVVKSGFPSGSPSTNQVWMKPYETAVMMDSGHAVSGWWDDHTVGGPGVWRDEMYASPDSFTHRSVNEKEIVMWGEMLGAATSDNHAAMVREIRRLGGRSYDLKEHEAVLAAYNRFIERWGFRSAFPTTDRLFTSIGNKSYDFWGRVIETARLSEPNDYFVISGWESTAIENHSGLVDNLRLFKGDPSLIASRLLPMKPVIRTRSLVFEEGDSLLIDCYMLNETEKPHDDSLTLSLSDPSGRMRRIGTYALSPRKEGRFVYPVAMAIDAGALVKAGEYVIRAQGRTSSAEERILVIQTTPDRTLPKTVGVVSRIPALLVKKEVLPGVTFEPWQKGKRYDCLVAANRFTRPLSTRTDTAVEIVQTEDDELYRTINYGDASSLEFLIAGLPEERARVTLKFAELFQEAPGMRVFDVALNDSVVLKDFDVFKAAGGKNRALDTAFTVLLKGGALRITFPRVPKPSARISAIRIDAADTVVTVNCGGSDYRDHEGRLWKSYGPMRQFDPSVLDAVRLGTPLLVLSEGDAAAEAFGRELGEAGAFTFEGIVGESLASWMGSWYFVRAHPLYDGLPVNCAMGSYYQAPVAGASGLVVDGPAVEIAAGYARDHSRVIAAGSFTSMLGKGRVVMHALPGAVSNLMGETTGIHPVIFRRLLANALGYAAVGTEARH